MIRTVLLIAVVALVALVLTGCERLFPDVEDWITDSETLARRFDARLGDLKECVEEDNCEEALDAERGVFVMCSWVMSRGELAPEGFEAAEWQRFDPTFPIWLNIPLSKSSAFFKPLSICETLAVGMAIITP